jgi:DNA-binding transcriptional LysR family regulator
MAVLPEFMVKTLIHQRKLVVCLPKFKLAESPLYAVYPQKEFVPLKVRAFIEVLKNYLREI